jgi:geranylgeranyl diphosphate synthase type II
MQFEKYQKEIDKQLSKIKLSNNPKELYDPVRYMLKMKSKRVRPILAILAYKLVHPNWKKVIQSCLSLELFHNFTLIHDDIMDKAPIRRGKKTIHEKWNKNIGILSGDLLMILAYNMISDLPKNILSKTMLKFNEISIKVCEGQQLDMNYQTRKNIDEKQYIEMIRLKTATLIGLSLQFGGLLANMNNNNLNTLYKIGELFGIGFQLRDDLLDVYGSKNFGKKIGGDILENKKTFLSVKAYELSSKKERKNLDYWKKNKKSSKEKIKKVTEIFDKLNLKELTEKKIKSFFNLAYKKLESLNVKNSNKEELTSYLSQLFERKI